MKRSLEEGLEHLVPRNDTLVLRHDAKPMHSAKRGNDELTVDEELTVDRTVTLAIETTGDAGTTVNTEPATYVEHTNRASNAEIHSAFTTTQPTDADGAILDTEPASGQQDAQPSNTQSG